MEEVNIWDLNKVNIKPKEDFLKNINLLIHKKFESKEKFYNKLENKYVPYNTFRNFLKYSYYKKGLYSPLNLFLEVCRILNISKENLQENIESYKTARGWNIIEYPILPIKITPIFDMILAHNIADGTVINPKRNRQIYFGYRQFDKEFRIAYIKKLESVFGKIKFKENYFNESTRPYCPSVLSSLFFKYYNLNSRSFLSKSARLPKKLLIKDKDHLLSVLLAFIIDEGYIDSTLIFIKLKNIDLTKDLCYICQKLNYKYKFVIDNEYGCLYILRDGMKKLFYDYKNLLNKYPEINLYKIENRINESLNIYNRIIYKTKGNKELILKMLEKEDLSVNQIARKINMTRQGTRFHIHNLENENKIIKKGFAYRKNILYGVKC